MKTRILIADQQEIVREDLARMLEWRTDIEVVARCSNGVEAVTQAALLKPDIAILALDLPGLSGLETTRQVLQQSSSAEVLILTDQESRSLIQDALAIGARGCLAKSATGTDLLRAVDCLRQHKPFFTARAANLLLEEFTPGPPAPLRPRARPLTPRERQVLQLLAEGHTNRVVASRLGISVKTAETHRANIMRKLALHSLPELVRYAIRHDLIRP